MTDNKVFFTSIMSLVIPLAFQNLINVGVQSANIVMLGRVSEKVLSAASLAGQINNIMSMILFGLTSGAAILTAQYWGKGETEPIEKIMGIAMRISLGVSLLFAIATFSFPSVLMKIFSSDPAVIAEGVKYLRVVCFSYVFYSFTMVYLNVMRSVERVIISTLVYLASLGLNIFLSSMLIFGRFGLPRLEIQGAATAVTAARFLELIIILIYNGRFNKVLRFRPSLLFVRDKELQKDFMTYSTPVVFNEMLWGAGMAANTAILGHMGSAAAAASSVVQVTRQLSMVLSFGIASATAITIGKILGESRLEKARLFSRKFMKLSLLSGLFSAVIVLAVRPIALSVMNLSPEAKEYLSFMMFVMAGYVIAQAFTCTCVVGIFRAGGDTKAGLLIDAGPLWFGSVLFGLLAAFVFDFSVQLVFLILSMDELIKIGLVLYRYRTYKWLNRIVR